MRDVPPVDKPLWTRLDDAELKKLTEYPGEAAQTATTSCRVHEAAGTAGESRDSFSPANMRWHVVTPSRDGRDGGGSGGTFFDDSGAGFGWVAYKREHADPVPVVVMAIENYGRVYRLLKANVPVSIEMNVDTNSPAITSMASTPSPKFPAPIPS